jgi:5-formyltetrahydrofolate cyclo-ligase
MIFHVYDAQRLVLHPFGMAEPASDSPVIAPEEIELTLVPGLAFDRLGFRLGYGGGYFDRFLKNFNGVSAGIVFHDLLFEKIPHSVHDIPMHWIITEQEIFSIQK